jgi:hypothetical protein
LGKLLPEAEKPAVIEAVVVRRCANHHDAIMVAGDQQGGQAAIRCRAASALQGRLGGRQEILVDDALIDLLGSGVLEPLCGAREMINLALAI